MCSDSKLEMEKTQVTRRRKQNDNREQKEAFKTAMQNLPRILQLLKTRRTPGPRFLTRAEAPPGRERERERQAHRIFFHSDNTNTTGLIGLGKERKEEREREKQNQTSRRFKSNSMERKRPTQSYIWAEIQQELFGANGSEITPAITYVFDRNLSFGKATRMEKKKKQNKKEQRKEGRKEGKQKKKKKKPAASTQGKKNPLRKINSWRYLQ